MIADLKPYPEYKESGLPWLGKVPQHWDVRPAFGAFEPNHEPNHGMKEKTVLSLSYGRIVIKPVERLRGLVPESFETYQIVNPGDIVLRTTDLQNDHTSLRVGMVRDRGIITSAYLALRLKAGVSPDFGFQFLNVWDTSKAIYGYGSGLRQNLDFSHFKRMPVAAPPLDGATVGHADHSGDLRKFIEQGKKIIVSTVQKFPFILDEIATEGGKTFAIVIDEAHSSQGGKTSAAMSKALAGGSDGEGDEPDPEDEINDAIEKRMLGRKMLSNASYFAFTATPKNRTLELFGQPLPPDAEGKVKHAPFDSYTMKQAVEERFILDVLKAYTPVESYYKLIKKIEDDPEFDTKKAKKKLRRYVESHDHAIRLKSEIMADHFHDHVIAPGKIGGHARAMVVTNGIARAIQYFHAFKTYLAERKSPYQAIIAFSGEHEYGGVKVSESSLNGFASGDIAAKIQEDPYRFLICADKFQTGYDEPLLHTMYVDKTLSGIKAVQTLSRLNRSHPQKHDCFVLDFQNNSEAITFAFQDYYRTTLLAEETDPNKLHDLKAALDNAQVYTPEQIQALVTKFLGGGQRDTLDPILDACVEVYSNSLDEDQQVDFKGKAKTFCRAYDFLSSILPYTNAEWEKLSILLNLLVPKLPAPKEQDLSQGILEAIDMDSYRVEKKAVMKIALADEDAEIEPVPTDGGGHRGEPELDRLSNILKSFNEQFSTLFSDADRVVKRIRDDIAPKVAADAAYKNAKENTPHTARMAHDQALNNVMQALLKDDTDVYKQFVENEAFKRFVSDMVYRQTST